MCSISRIPFYIFFGIFSSLLILITSTFPEHTVIIDLSSLSPLSLLLFFSKLVFFMKVFWILADSELDRYTFLWILLNSLFLIFREAIYFKKIRIFSKIIINLSLISCFQIPDKHLILPNFLPNFIPLICEIRSYSVHLVRLPLQFFDFLHFLQCPHPMMMLFFFKLQRFLIQTIDSFSQTRNRRELFWEALSPDNQLKIGIFAVFGQDYGSQKAVFPFDIETATRVDKAV